MFRLTAIATMIVATALLTQAQEPAKKQEPKIMFVNLDFEIKTIEYVKYEGFAVRVPIINGYMPSEIKVSTSNTGETDIGFTYKDKTPYDKAKIYKKKEGPGGGLGISEKHGDGPEIEVYRCEFYVPVLPKPKLQHPPDSQNGPPKAGRSYLIVLHIIIFGPIPQGNAR